MSSNKNDEIGAQMLRSLRSLGRAEAVTEPVVDDRLMAAVQSVLAEADECRCGRLSSGEGAQQVEVLRRLVAEQLSPDNTP